MPRRSWLCLTLLVGVVAFPLKSAPAGEGAKLEWKLKQDETFYVETISTDKQTMEVAGTKVDSETESTIVFRYKVLKLDMDATVIEQRIETIKSKSSGGFPGTDKIMESLKGATFKLTLNPKGEVTKVEGYDEFIKKLGSDNEASAKLIKMVMSEETVKASASEDFGFLPDKPVAKGDTWKKAQAVPLGPLGGFKGETTFTFKGPGKDGDEIAYEQALTYSPPKEDDGGALGLKVTKSEMKAEKATGTIVFDATKGRPVRMEANRKMKGSLTVEALGTTNMISVELQQTSKSRVLDKSPLD